MEGKNKKFLFAVGLVSILVAAGLAAVIGNGMRRANMMGYGNYQNGGYVMPGRVGYVYPDSQNEFALPQDALKSGELAVIVSDLDSANKKIIEIASQNDGKVFATNISYSSNQIKNASIVLQMPIEKFEQIFASLKGAGFQIVQESTRQIQPSYIYPLAQTAVSEQIKAEESQVASDNSGQAAADEVSEPSQASPDGQGVTEPQKVIYPQPQIQTQDKGYIKLVLADYRSKNSNLVQSRQNGMMFFSYGNSDIPRALWVGFALKFILLIVFVVLLARVFIKALKTLHHHRKSKKSSATKLSTKRAVVHVIRKTPKARVVKK